MQKSLAQDFNSCHRVPHTHTHTHIYIYIYTYISTNSGCLSNPMMTFAFYNSSMSTEVAPQPQPRGTDSLTVGALEVSCDHCRGCSAVSLSGSCEFLVLSLFEVGSSFMNRVSPFWSVHGISLQVSRIDVAPLEIGFDCIFIPQFWSTLVSFAGLEFPVQQASRHPTLLHLNHVSNPSKLGLNDGGLYAGGLSLIEDHQIGDVVLPPDSQNGAKSSHVEELQFLDMPAIQCPHFTTIEEGGRTTAL